MHSMQDREIIDNKLLFLDDEEYRHVIFRQNFGGSGWFNLFHAHTAKEAIDNLKRYKFAVIFLDHDLGSQAYVASSDGTGYEVAKWLSERYSEHQGSEIIIHSWNQVGAKNMHSILRQVGYSVNIVPFPCSEVSLNLEAVHGN